MINTWIKSAANTCAIMGISQADAEDWIRQAMNRREKNPREVSWTVQRSYQSEFTGATSTPTPTFAPFNRNALNEVARPAVEHFGTMEDLERWLSEESPEAVDCSPAKFLDAILDPSERACVCRDDYDTGFVYKPDQDGCAERLANYLRNTDDGAKWITNPVSGERDERSYRTINTVTSFRHLLVESDCKEFAFEWICLLVQLHAPIIALTYSGDRGVHAIVRVDATKKQEFDQISKEYRRQLVPLGADENAGKAVQLSRLPNVFRESRENWQRLLWLDPDATEARPIWQPPEKKEARPVTS
jgi:hypothetical protein